MKRRKALWADGVVRHQYQIYVHIQENERRISIGLGISLPNRLSNDRKEHEVTHMLIPKLLHFSSLSLTGMYGLKL